MIRYTKLEAGSWASLLHHTLVESSPSTVPQVVPPAAVEKLSGVV